VWTLELEGFAFEESARAQRTPKQKEYCAMELRCSHLTSKDKK
jgi:hypothetical protein